MNTLFKQGNGNIDTSHLVHLDVDCTIDENAQPVRTVTQTGRFNSMTATGKTRTQAINNWVSQARQQGVKVTAVVVNNYTSGNYTGTDRVPTAV